MVAVIPDGDSQCQSVTSVALPCSWLVPVEIKVVWHATENCLRILFCAKRNRNAQPSRRRRRRPSPLCVSGTPLVLHQSFDKLPQPRSRHRIDLLSNDRQRAMALFQKKAFDCDVRTFQFCADYGCCFLLSEFDLRPHAYVLSRRLSGEDTEIKLYWVSSGNLGEKGPSSASRNTGRRAVPHSAAFLRRRMSQCTEYIKQRQLPAVTERYVILGLRVKGN